MHLYLFILFLVQSNIKHSAFIATSSISRPLVRLRTVCQEMKLMKIWLIRNSAKFENEGAYKGIFGDLMKERESFMDHLFHLRH